jgi:hypothetical protein
MKSYNSMDDMYSQEAKERAVAQAEQKAFENTTDPIEAFDLFVKRHIQTPQLNRTNYDLTTDVEVVREVIRRAVDASRSRPATGGPHSGAADH